MPSHTYLVVRICACQGLDCPDPHNSTRGLFIRGSSLHLVRRELVDDRDWINFCICRRLSLQSLWMEFCGQELLCQTQIHSDWSCLRTLNWWRLAPQRSSYALKDRPQNTFSTSCHLIAMLYQYRSADLVRLFLIYFVGWLCRALVHLK